MRRGAEVQTDQGSRCLSEASLARPRLDRAPQVARSEAEGRSNQGRLFFCLLFFWRSKRKVSSRRATPGQQPSEEGRKEAEVEAVCGGRSKPRPIKPLQPGARHSPLPQSYSPSPSAQHKTDKGS